MHTFYESEEQCDLPRSVRTPVEDRLHAIRDKGNDAEHDWVFHLDYSGYRITLHTTDCVVTSEERELGIANDIWRSRIRIGLPKPLPGTPEAVALKECNWAVLQKYIHLLARQVPIIREFCRTYTSPEEATRGHTALQVYLEQFACARHLFDDVIEEMEHQRTMFLLGTDAAKPLPFAELVALRQHSLITALDLCEHSAPYVPHDWKSIP